MISKKSQIYAQALFELESSQELFNQLQELSNVFTEPYIRDFFLSHTVSQENKKETLNRALKQSSSLLKNFFFVLLDNRTFSFLPQIVLAYKILLEEKSNSCTGTIYSPSPLSLEQRKDVEKQLQKFFNKRLVLGQKEDKTLVGGLYIKAGNVIFDGTVTHYLKQFKNSGG